MGFLGDRMYKEKKKKEIVTRYLDRKYETGNVPTFL